MNNATQPKHARVDEKLKRDMANALRKCAKLDDQFERMETYCRHLYGLFDYSEEEIDAADADAYLTESARRYSNV